MEKAHKSAENLESYWCARYEKGRTGWDIGYASLPLQAYIEQIENKEISILIPGAGYGYEAEYLFKNGFSQVDILDIASPPLKAFQSRVPEFPSSQLIKGNFFKHTGSYDLILEQTFFCSFDPYPETRQRYAQQMHSLLRPGGKLVGLWFNHPLDKEGKRPFGGTREEYLTYFTPYFTIKTMEDCYNSIKPRMGSELFGILERK